MSCFTCENTAHFTCKKCKTALYCSSKCKKLDTSHTLVCNNAVNGLPPFPIPQQIAFLAKSSIGTKEKELYGTQTVLESAIRYGIDTTAYKLFLDNELGKRRTLIRQFINVLNADNLNESVPDWAPSRFKPQWKRRMFSGQSTTIQKWILSPTHVLDTFDQFELFIEDTFDELLQYAKSDDKQMFTRTFQSLMEQLVTNDDYVLNCVHVPKIAQWLLKGQEKLIKKLEMSNQRIVDAKHEIYLAMRKKWRITAPSFDDLFSPASAFVDRKALRVVREGALFYRGQGTYMRKPDYKRVPRPGIPKRDTVWFALDPWASFGYIVPYSSIDQPVSDHCKRIGEISAFKATSDFVLFDMTNIDNIKRMRYEISQDKDPESMTVEAFDEIWNIETGKIRRESQLAKDIVWINWLCSHGYDGYIADSVTGLHSEMFLCKWSDNLKYIGSYRSKDVLRMDFCKTPFSKTAFSISDP